MKENTKISVITPLYHGAKYMELLLKMVADNVAHCKNCSVEYLFVNDSPWEAVKTDILSNVTGYSCRIELATACHITYIGTYKKDNIAFDVKILENTQNCGIHQARVHGLFAAEGTYIYFLDQDDEVANTAFKHLTQAMHKKQADVCIGNGYRKWNHSDKKLPLYKTKLAQHLATKEWSYLYGTDMILSPGQCMIRTQAIPQQWKEDILPVNGCDDFYLWMLMFQDGCTFITTPHHFYNHMENDANYSNSSDAMADSYYRVCAQLENNTNYPHRKVAVLKRRYRLKQQMKAKKAVIAKLRAVLCNLDVIAVTVLYKVAGFH